MDHQQLISTRLLFLSFNPYITCIHPVYIMSRPQGHRKSQSTSALNVLASNPTSASTSDLSQSTATPRSRRTQGSTRLGSVVEDDSEREERSHAHSHSQSTSHTHEDSKEGLDGLLGMISSRTPRKERHHDKGKSTDPLGEEDLRAAVGDVSSLVYTHHLNVRDSY